MEKIVEILPNAQFEEDKYGQVIIYTDMTVDADDNSHFFLDDDDWTTAATERYPDVDFGPESE